MKVLPAPPAPHPLAPSPIAHPSPGRGAPPPNPCSDQLPPLPAEGWAMGEGGRGGEVGRGKRRLLVAAAFFAAPFLIWFLLNLLFPFPWETLNRPPATVVTDHPGEPLRFFLPTDHRWRFPVRLAELPPELPEALVASEDQRFRRHLGVDP